MFNNMNKKEIAGLVIGGLSTIAGLGIMVYAKIKCDKEANEIENITETINECTEELNELLKNTGAIETAIEESIDKVTEMLED